MTDKLTQSIDNLARALDRLGEALAEPESNPLAIRGFFRQMGVRQEGGSRQKRYNQLIFRASLLEKHHPSGKSFSHAGDFESIKWLTAQNPFCQILMDVKTMLSRGVRCNGRFVRNDRRQNKEEPRKSQ